MQHFPLIAATLNSTGSTAVVLNSQNALHGDLGIISDGDAIVALSYSGGTSELLDLLPFIKRFDVKIIAITGKGGSTLDMIQRSDEPCRISSKTSSQDPRVGS